MRSFHHFLKFSTPTLLSAFLAPETKYRTYRYNIYWYIVHFGNKLNLPERFQEQYKTFFFFLSLNHSKVSCRPDAHNPHILEWLFPVSKDLVHNDSKAFKIRKLVLIQHCYQITGRPHSGIAICFSIVLTAEGSSSESSVAVSGHVSRVSIWSCISIIPWLLIPWYLWKF